MCRHINSGAFLSRGELSQDILAQLRNFVKHVMLKLYAGSGDIDDSYDNIKWRAIAHMVHAHVASPYGTNYRQ